MLAIFLLVICLPSALLLLVGGSIWALSPQEPVFLPADQAAVFENLGDRADAGDVVLASFNTGNALPAWAPLRVVAGHGPESANLDSVLPRLEAFYDAATPDDERVLFLDEFAIDYVFWGPEERMLGSWIPNASHLLIRVIQWGDYEVFEIATP